MKNCKLFGIIALIAIIVFGACSSPAGGGDPATPKITMTTTVSGVTYIYLLGTGEATIDWGDGSLPDEETLNSSNNVIELWLSSNTFQHTYGSGVLKTITVTGDVTGFAVNGNGIAIALNVSGVPGLKFLSCNSEAFTALDLSKNTALEYLDCDLNQLTALDLSKNTKLEYLNCTNNQLTSLNIGGCTELELIYCNNNNLDSIPLANVLDNLPDRRSLTLGYIDVSGNPGATGHVYDAAKINAEVLKNWKVDD